MVWYLWLSWLVLNVISWLSDAVFTFSRLPGLRKSLHRPTAVFRLLFGSVFYHCIAVSCTAFFEGNESPMLWLSTTLTSFLPVLKKNDWVSMFSFCGAISNISNQRNLFDITGIRSTTNKANMFKSWNGTGEWTRKCIKCKSPGKNYIVQLQVIYFSLQ